MSDTRLIVPGRCILELIAKEHREKVKLTRLVWHLVAAMIALVAGRTALTGRNDGRAVRNRWCALLGRTLGRAANAETNVARMQRIVRQLQTLREEMGANDAAATALRAHFRAQIVLIRVVDDVAGFDGGCCAAVGRIGGGSSGGGGSRLLRTVVANRTARRVAVDGLAAGRREQTLWLDAFLAAGNAVAVRTQ